MALLLWALLVACLPALCAGQSQGPFARALDWDEAAQRNVLLAYSEEVLQKEALPPADFLPEAGPESESQLAVLGPTKLPPPIPDEAASPGHLVSDGSKGLGGHPNSLEGQEEEEEEEEEEEQGCVDSALSPSVHKIAWAMRALGVDLLRELEAEQSKDNTLFSPLSLSLSLAHLALGAANQTQKRLLEVLHMDSVPCLHQALRRVSRHLHETALSIAGRLYLEKGFPIKETFLKESQRFYGVKPAVLSGNSEADLAAINSWVEEATNGQISTMLTELPPGVVMVLLNAVYFQGFWKTKFDPLLTEPSMFHLDDEFAVSVEMMKEQEYPLSWFSMESLDGQVAKFPFKGNTTFVAIIPSHHERNFSEFLSEVLQVNLETSFPEERSTIVKMPKLHLQDHTDLNQALIRLGGAKMFLKQQLLVEREGILQLLHPSRGVFLAPSPLAAQAQILWQLASLAEKAPQKLFPALQDAGSHAEADAVGRLSAAAAPAPEQRPELELLRREVAEVPQGNSDLTGHVLRGLGELFSSPDLRPIAEGPLLVSSVQHQATLDLAEAGVQASAATSVVTYRSFSAFCLDQPFIFMILEETTGVPLFFGSIRNPNPGAPRQKTKGFPLSEEKEGLPFAYLPDPLKP